ncbi:Uncharacterised protein [Candidatus Anstonella stagnisolia]|nr:Uncharacterised protein [Candidatus Anstonella stagnisolia]
MLMKQTLSPGATSPAARRAAKDFELARMVHEINTIIARSLGKPLPEPPQLSAFVPKETQRKARAKKETIQAVNVQAMDKVSPLIEAKMQTAESSRKLRAAMELSRKKPNMQAQIDSLIAEVRANESKVAALEGRVAELESNQIGNSAFVPAHVEIVPSQNESTAALSSSQCLVALPIEFDFQGHLDAAGISDNVKSVYLPLLKGVEKPSQITKLKAIQWALKNGVSDELILSVFEVLGAKQAFEHGYEYYNLQSLLLSDISNYLTFLERAQVARSFGRAVQMSHIEDELRDKHGERINVSNILFDYLVRKCGMPAGKVAAFNVALMHACCSGTKPKLSINDFVANGHHFSNLSMLASHVRENMPEIAQHISLLAEIEPTDAHLLVRQAIGHIERNKPK